MKKPKLTAGVAKRKWVVVPLIAVLNACSAPEQETTGTKDIIAPGDPHFNVFQLTNSARKRTSASGNATVYLSFSTEDSGYCRAARFHTDNIAVLACRNQSGWQIEATNDLAPANNDGTSVGNSITPAVNEAILRLNPKAEFLNELEVAEAAAKGWQ